MTWDDPRGAVNPNQWSPQRKWLVVGTALIACLIVPLNGTAMTVAATEINERFGISDASFPNSYWPVASWNVGGAVFVITLLPLMEDLGVRMTFLPVYAFFFLMVIPQALAQNFATLIVTRFFSGGCVALLANTSASVIPDLWVGDRARDIPIGIWILIYVYGNTLGPPVFGGVMQYIGDWRW